MPETETPAKPTVDPFVTELANSFGVALDETAAIKPQEAKKPEDIVVPIAERTLSETVLLNADKAEAEKKAAETTKEPAKEETKAADKTETTTAATAEKKDEKASEAKDAKDEKKEEKPPGTEASDALTKSLTDLKQTPPATTQTTKTEAPKPPAEDVEYIKTLSDDERDALEFAAFAEQKGQKDAYKKAVGFFRARDKFVTENPGLTPESQEFTEFLEKNKPKLPASLERKFIAEQAAAKAREESAKETAELRDRQRALELAPLIDKTVDRFKTVMTSGELKLDKEIVPISADVGKAIEEKGYEAAKKQFPVEAPIYMGTVQMASEFLKVSNGLVPWDPASNRTHQWLDGFIAKQEQFVMQDESRRMVDGRKFVTAAEYAGLGPEELNKHWTLSDKDILDMIAANGHLQAHHQRRDFEENAKAMGWSKAEPTKPANNGAAATATTKETTTQTTTTQSPRAGVTAMPGAAQTTAPKNPNAGFLDALVPGASQRI